MAQRLLRIDIDAEIRKLVDRRYKTPADYAVELLRWAAGKSPQRIDVDVSRARFALRFDAPGLSADSLRALGVLLDPDKPAEERHAALLQVEKGEPRLLASLSLPGALVRIVSAHQGRAVGCELSRRGARSVEADTTGGSRIEVRGRGRKMALERSLLADAARHSTLPVYVDGARVNRGLLLEDAIVHVDLRNERVHGVAGLPLKSDLSRIRRLERGILAEERILPAVGGMVLLAVVEERDDDFDATQETLRRAGRHLYLRLARIFETLPADRRERAFELLAGRYEHTHEATLLAGVRAFVSTQGSRFSLDDVKVLAQAGSVAAIGLDEPVGRYDLSGCTALRLSPKQRAFLEKALARRLEPPPLKGEERGFRARLASLKKAWDARFTDPLGGTVGRPVEDGELEPDELAFLDAVRAEIRSGAFALPEGGKPFGVTIRMTEKQATPFARRAVRGFPSEYGVSRSHPLVRDMIAAFAADRGFLYPALSALARGHDGYADNRSEARRGV